MTLQEERALYPLGVWPWTVTMDFPMIVLLSTAVVSVLPLMRWRPSVLKQTQCTSSLWWLRFNSCCAEPVLHTFTVRSAEAEANLCPDSETNKPAKARGERK